MHKSYFATGALLAGIAVTLGAFGAHGLQQLTQDEKLLHGFQTGVQYQFYHSLALLLLGISAGKIPPKWVKWSGACFIGGILLFSGSLYLLSFPELHQTGAAKFIGPLTPLGGLFLVAGWFLLFIAALKIKRS